MNALEDEEVDQTPTRRGRAAGRSGRSGRSERGRRVLRVPGTPRTVDRGHVAARVDFTMDGPCGTALPARLWRDDGRLTLALDLDEAPDPDSTLVRALHAGLVARRIMVDLVHQHRVVLTLGAR